MKARSLDILVLFVLGVLFSSCGEATPTAMTPFAPRLTITEPADGATVSTDQVTVRGDAPSGATVMRDVDMWFDDKITADASGHWQYVAKLEKGTNELKFHLASNQDVRATVTVSYEPSTPTAAAFNSVRAESSRLRW